MIRRLCNLNAISLTDEFLFSFPMGNEVTIDSEEGNYCSHMFNPLLEAMAENRGRIESLVLNMGSRYKQLPIECSTCRPTPDSVSTQTTDSYQIDATLLANSEWNILHFNGKFQFINPSNSDIEMAVNHMSTLDTESVEKSVSNPFQSTIQYRKMEDLYVSSNYLDRFEVDESEESNLYATVKFLTILSSAVKKIYSLGNDAERLFCFVSKFRNLTALNYDVADKQPGELRGLTFWLDFLKCVSTSCVVFAIGFHGLSFPSIIQTVDDIVTSVVETARIHSTHPVRLAGSSSSSSQTRKLMEIQLRLYNVDFFRSRKNCIELVKHLVPLKNLIKTKYIWGVSIHLENYSSPHLQASTPFSSSPYQERFPHLILIEENEFFSRKEGFQIKYRRGVTEQLITVNYDPSSL